MIVGTLATYPPRSESLRQAVASVAPQLDRLVLVLNQHRAVPGWVSDHPNVTPVLPQADTRDTGKFLDVPGAASWVVTLDDDIIYPPDYVLRSIAGHACAVRALGTTRLMVGFLGWTYRRARFAAARWLRRLIGYNPNYIATSWDMVHFASGLDRARVVEGLGTGVSVMRAADVPPFEFVRDAQRFVDVRLGRWCFERGILQVMLPRPDGWLRPAATDQPGETIFEGFTRRQPDVLAQEIWRYAFRNPQRGAQVDFGFADMAAPA